jgi:hypothetical protein
MARVGLMACGTRLHTIRPWPREGEAADDMTPSSGASLVVWQAMAPSSTGRRHLHDRADKAKVEVGVQIAERWLLARIRNVASLRSPGCSRWAVQVFTMAGMRARPRRFAARHRLAQRRRPFAHLRELAEPRSRPSRYAFAGARSSPLVRVPPPLHWAMIGSRPLRSVRFRSISDRRSSLFLGLPWFLR